MDVQILFSWCWIVTREFSGVGKPFRVNCAGRPQSLELVAAGGLRARNQRAHRPVPFLVLQREHNSGSSSGTQRRADVVGAQSTA